ncbi:hypothetical protein SS50377_24420 [Spironucleus salmonicida]|uniref:Leucine rich repeat-containing protein n=1 Tax=Spironucleus salmonicida TaxID=348837 RepID=V6LN30_9EUKA|nr:hypothetical protein SS50377_24420 [Spironucleus salmonicida]|eukprot:EST46030.1 hypothetical protein SS50377_14018 [Spironucleus salmonicida]
MEDALRRFQNLKLEQITLEGQSKTAISDDIPEIVNNLARQLTPLFWNRLIAINLSSSNLTVFPSCLKICESLQELNLSKNNLSRLPSQFFVQYFPFLKIIDVSDNYLNNIYDIQKLGQLHELEVLSVQGNMLPQIASRIEFLSTILFCKISENTLFNRNLNRFAVFMNLGNHFVIQNSFIDQLKLVVKAEEFISLNGLDQLKNGAYESNELPVDVTQLVDGSLFSKKGEVWFNGPGCVLIKDDRLEAPIVVLGSCKDSQLMGINERTRKLLMEETQQYDQILNTQNNTFVQQHVIKYGFFGSTYFCYDLPIKTRQTKQNSRQLSTTELINKKVVKDQKISSTSNNAKLEKLSLDIINQLPSEIEKYLLNKCQEQHFIVNLNQRKLTDTGMFRRLRVLNGLIITVSDYDGALQSHNLQNKSRIMMLQAAQPIKQNVPQPPMMKQIKSTNSQKVTGQAAEDLKCEPSAINTTKNMSEEIRKRQVYDRVIKLNKDEQIKAQQEIKEFIKSGQLTDDDNEYQFSMILRAYDEETDPDVFTFIQKCKELQSEYALEQTQNDQQHSKGEDFVQNLLAKDDLTMSQRFQQTFDFKSTQSYNNQVSTKTLNIDDLKLSTTNQIPESDYLKKLSMTTSSVGVNHRNFSNNINSPEQQTLISTRQSPSKEQKSQIVEKDSRAIEVAMLQSQLAQEQLDKYKLQKANQPISMGVIKSNNMSTSLNVTEENALLSTFKMSLDYADPMNHVQENTMLYTTINEQQSRFQHVSKSQIGNPIVITDASKIPLPLESQSLSFQDIKDQTMQHSQFSKALPTVQRSKLEPSFDEVLREEIIQQHQATSQLFKQTSERLDPQVRRQLGRPDSQYSTVDTKHGGVSVMRHSALLDVVMQGDAQRAAANRYNLKDSTMNRLKKPTMAQSPKKQNKRLNGPLAYTSQELMQNIDSSLTRQNLQFEFGRKDNFANSDTQQQHMLNQLVKQNNEDIEKQIYNKNFREHQRKMKLINEQKQMDQYYDKASGPLLVYVKQKRKVEHLQEKNEQIKLRKHTASGNATQNQTINKSGGITRHGKVINVLNIQSVEEAAEQASTMKVTQGELIDVSSYIMKNANTQISQLHNYGNSFIQKEMLWDEQQQDPVYKLTRNGQTSDFFKELDNEKPIENFKITEECKRFNNALLQQKDTKNIFKSQISQARQIAQEVANTLFE